MNTEHFIPFKDVKKEEIQNLINMVHRNPHQYRLLSDDEKEIIKKAKVMCPAQSCNSEYALFDQRQGKARKYCSRDCSIQARSTRKWQCALCKRRYKSSWGLKKHIEKSHPDYSLHQYLLEYFRVKGYDTRRLKPFCCYCGSQLEVRIEKSLYNTCRCVNAGTAIKRLEIDLGNTVEPDEIKRIKNQIRGCKSTITKMRSRRLPIPESDNDLLNKSYPKKFSSRRKPVRRNDLISTRPGHDLRTSHLYFKGVYGQFKNVHDEYYRMISAWNRKNMILMEDARNSLRQMLHEERWSTTDPKSSRNSYYTHVHLAEPNDSKPGEFVPITYFKRLPIDYFGWHDTLITNLQCDNKVVSEYIAENPALFPYPFIEDIHYQSWYRIIAVDMRSTMTQVFNPSVIYAICKALEKEKSR